MKVYVLSIESIDGPMVWGVYKNKTTAQEWIDRQNVYVQGGCEIVERVVVE
jgi:hypothetical protein